MKKSVSNLLYVKKEEKATWEDVIDEMCIGDIYAERVDKIEIELRTKDWLELIEGESDENKAEILLAIENGDYKAEYYQGDNPSKDMVLLTVCGYDFKL
jgi:hypothetical protein